MFYLSVPEVKGEVCQRGQCRLLLFKVSPCTTRRTVMTRTRLLIWIVALVALLEIFPDKVGRIEVFAVVAALVYCAAWVIPKYLGRRKEQAAQTALALSDDKEYLQYSEELAAIRAKYDPQRDLDDPTSISAEYQAEISALHDRHEAMLKRKFGPRS
jgi:hypothetical protein